MLKKAMPPMLLLFLVFAPIVCSAASESSLNISNTGVIVYSSTNPTWVPSDAILLWEKEWTDLTTNIPDWVVLFEPDGISTENGMLKLTGNLGTQTPARRPRVYTNTDSPLYDADEYYMKAVFMFPTGHPLQDWQVFFEPLSDQPAPYTTLQFVLTGSNGEVDIEYKDVTNQVYVDRAGNVFQVTYGVPFEVIVHVIRHESNGLIEAWINGNEVYTYQGKTIWKDNTYNLAIVADNYKSASEVTNNVYQQSIEIWMR